VTVLAVAESGGPTPATTTADLESASERAVEVLQPTGADTTTELRGALRGTHASDVRSVILDAVDELVPDLVVVGTRGLGRLQRMVLGSTATAVVRHAPCSVLVVP
jgi:nucleotide-binding universal stress UspA family protein